MTRAATQAEHFDHNHDLRKHEPRPDDPIAEAYEIALLVRNQNLKISAAADLIQQYGRTCESKGRLDGVTQTLDRIAPPVQS